MCSLEANPSREHHMSMPRTVLETSDGPARSLAQWESPQRVEPRQLAVAELSAAAKRVELQSQGLWELAVPVVERVAAAVDRSMAAVPEEVGTA